LGPHVVFSYLTLALVTKKTSQNALLAGALTEVNSLTPWDRVVLEKAILAHIAKEFPSILRNHKFHYPVRKSPPLVPVFSIPISIFFFYLRLYLPSGIFLSDFPTRT
jgi:hypothetical protein